MLKNSLIRLIATLTISAPIVPALASHDNGHRSGGTAAADRTQGLTQRSTADNVADLQADDARMQVLAAQQLGTAPLDEGARATVLKALEPHLASDDRTLRLASVNAYVHWATPQEAAQLEKVIASRSTKEAQDGSAGVCAAALIGLIRVAPTATDNAVRERMDDFFFRDRATQLLLNLAEKEPASSASAIKLLKLVDPDDQSLKLSPTEAVAMLANDSASSRTAAANALKIAAVTASDRSAVLHALSTHLQAKDGRTRLPFVRAFVHWADDKSITDLQAIVAYPEQAGRAEGQEECWAAAIAGMVRLNAGSAAVDVYNSRVEDVRLNAVLQRDLEDIARGTGPSQPLASDLLEQLKVPRAGKLKPVAPATPAASPGNRA